MSAMNEYFDTVIVGTGAAGLYCALNLPERMKILLVTKLKADESDSFLASRIWKIPCMPVIMKMT